MNWLCLGLLLAQAPNVKLEGPQGIARGAEIFASTCGIGYCHGKAGAAGRGPRLAGRKLDKDYLFRVISDGINNSLMPAFKDRYNPTEIWSIVAYIQSLSSDSPDPRLPFPDPRPALNPQTPSPNPQGFAIFFDPSNPKRCAACHQFQGKGADVGPDLSGVSSRSPKDLLQDIINPDARLAIEPVTVVTKSGERVTGVKKQETRELIRIYDTRSIPPVLRTIYKDQVESLTPEKHSPMPADYGQVLTRQQLIDLIAFLRSSPVSPEDLE